MMQDRPYQFGLPGAINRAFDRYAAAMNLACLRRGGGSRPLVSWGQRGRFFG